PRRSSSARISRRRQRRSSKPLRKRDCVSSAVLCCRIASCHRRYVRPSMARFALSTSDAMLEMCQTLRREHQELRVQSHVNENADEIRMVAEQFRWAADYVSVYERFGLSGPRTVFAHNVHATNSELERLAAAGTAIAHCPTSNAALGSGIFPMRRH